MVFLPFLQSYAFVVLSMFCFSAFAYEQLPENHQYTPLYESLKNQRGKVLSVGPGQTFALPSMAAKKAVDGDIIEIHGDGSYLGDTAVWKQSNLYIKGVSGRPHIKGDGLIKNGKGIWVIKGDNITISNIEISGAKVRHKNGAALRLEGKNFHISDCYIHDSQNGILGGRDHSDNMVTIENCEFAFNGYGKGRTHNVYIGEVTKLLFRGNYTHDAFIGHTLKSRARENYILYNRITEGKSSYSIDLPNGGYALVMGNIIYQGQDTENRTMLAYGLERKQYDNNQLNVTYNTFVNERSYSVFIKARGNNDVQIKNNLFSGNGAIIKGKAIVSNNVHENDLVAKFDVNEVLIKSDYLPRIIDKGIEIVGSSKKSFLPEKEFNNGHLVNRTIHGKQYDIGAFEYSEGILDLLR